jgi:lipopolysaccharide biosynthesis glycosyltransferase
MIHVACAAEGAYVPHSAAMLHSVLAQTDEVQVHYLHGPGFHDAAALRALVATIAFHVVPAEAVAGFPSQHRFTPAMWYRLFLPELLPDVDRVLYLDADTLAMGPLAELWGTDLEGHWVAAVTNVFEPWSVGRPKELGLAGPEAYFNSGVLLFNLAEMRRDDRGEALRELVRARGDELLWPDQDALNLVLGERRLALHPRWNCMNSVLAFDAAREVFGAEAAAEAREHPGIRHFEGPDANKPWHLLCEAPGREAYFEHRRATPWPRVRREGVTPLNLLRRARQGLTATRPV